MRALATAGLGASDPNRRDRETVRHRPGLGEGAQWTIRVQLAAPTIFRVDHFLSSELVRRVVSLRFLNRVFAPAWNSEHIDHVDISWLEDLTLERRASYYDGAGAMKDMLQNHLMEVMALVMMEQPARLDAASFRAVRVEALRAVSTPAPERLRRPRCALATPPAASVRARSRRTSTSPGLTPDADTETYAALILGAGSPRWSGVPFTIRSGKALERPSAEIAVHFRALPRYLTDQWPGVEPNVLRIGLTEPYVRL